MSISTPFIRRPVATLLLAVGVAMAGGLGYSQLPVAALPQVDYPTIVVSTALPGASADTMARSVTTPLERSLGQMPSVSVMTSVSTYATSQITVQFLLDRPIDAAEQDVQAAINAATTLLPKTLPAPPTYSKSNPADTPVLTLSVRSKHLPIRTVDDYADSVLAQKLSQVSGVGLVTLNGSQKPAVRVKVDPAALAGTGLTLEDVRTAIVAANVNQPKGNLDGHRLDYTISTNDQLQRAADFEPVVIAYKNGASLRLGDIAKVEDGVENEQLAGWAGDDRAIIVNVQRQPGANLIEVTDRVRKLLPQLAASMPRGIDVAVMSDRTETVRASVADVQFTLLLTIGLVVLVIYVFLRSLRATFVPGVAVPLSLIITFGVMHLLGFSLNNLSLMALTISTGFVVDDAIVMVENISRYIEAGETPFNAALKGAAQIGFTIVSLTVSLIAVLIPLLFMGGIIGRLFREFAVTLATAIGMSALVSLTVTPMMCAYLLKPHEEAKPGRFGRFFESGFTRLTGFYERTLRVVMQHRFTTLLVTIFTIVLTGLLAIVIPKGFFPTEDTGIITGISEAAQDTSFARMMERQRAVADVLRADPDVASVASFIGADGTNLTTNSGRFSITLKPREARSSNAQEIIERLRPKLDEIDGVDVWLQAVQDLQIDNRLARTPYQYTLTDSDLDELTTWSTRLTQALRKRPELKDVASDLSSGGLALQIVVDRDSAGRLGITQQAIDDTLYDAFGQRQVSLIFTQLNLYRVILEVRPQDQRDQSALGRIYVKSADAGLVPLSAFCHYETRPTALAISHEGQFPSATLSFDAAAGYALGDAVKAIAEVEKDIGLPSTVRAEFEGAAAAFSDSLKSEPLLVLAALITVYIVLGILYESYIHPITILSTLPSAGVGALLALLVCGVPFSIIALIGIILLVGIVKKNAIMMIDFALEAERDHGKSPDAAIFEACLLRFRPIMMTTAAALLGALPLALSRGTGSELRQPLGISIVGGLLVSQVLTLYTTPVIYLYMEKLAKKRKEQKSVRSVDVS
ncbi:MAG: multidrug efflux RND transporter permease subunit [Polyangia bacterium]